jgi:hypothetical protein
LQNARRQLVTTCELESEIWVLGFQPNHSLTVWRWWNAWTAETEWLEALSEINVVQIFENGGAKSDRLYSAFREQRNRKLA